MPTINPIIQVSGSGGGSGGTYSRNVQVLTSSGTWNKPSGLVLLEVICIGGGGGGGSGAKAAAGSLARGGGGASPGNICWGSFRESDLSSSEDYIVGAGGVGGASQTTNGGGNNAGSDGGNTFFAGSAPNNALVRADGGNGSIGFAAGSNSSTGSIYSNNGHPTGYVGLAGALGVANGNTSPATNQNFTFHYNNIFGAGAGGGVTTSNLARAGGNGCRVYSGEDITISPANGGAIDNNGGNGQNHYFKRIPYLMSFLGYSDVSVGVGTSAGGGGSSVTGNGGNGGNGGLYGGAGGGGGGARNDVGNSGAGGNGGDGCIILIEHIVN